jgi:hypothetical protein
MPAAAHQRPSDSRRQFKHFSVTVSGTSKVSAAESFGGRQKFLIEVYKMVFSGRSHSRLNFREYFSAILSGKKEKKQCGFNVMVIAASIPVKLIRIWLRMIFVDFCPGFSLVKKGECNYGRIRS